MAKAIKYVAKHLIPVTMALGKPGDKAKGVAPTPPQVKNVEPNQRVMLDPEDENTQFLVDNGAIVKADKDDERAPVNLKPSEAKPASKPKADDDGGDGGEGGSGGGDGGEGGGSEKAAADMTIAELKAALKEKGVEFAKDTKKADLVKLLEGGEDEDLV